MSTAGDRLKRHARSANAIRSSGSDGGYPRRTLGDEAELATLVVGRTMGSWRWLPAGTRAARRIAGIAVVTAAMLAAVTAPDALGADRPPPPARSRASTPAVGWPIYGHDLANSRSAGVA